MSDQIPPKGPIRGPDSWFSGDEEPPNMTGDLGLPHWTEPGTDVVDTPDVGPRWRDGASDYNELDDIRLLDPSPPEGLDSTRGASEVFFGLDDDAEDTFAADLGAPPPPPPVVPTAAAAAAAPAAAPPGQPTQRARVGARTNRPAAPDTATPRKGSDRDLVMATATGLGLAALALGSLWLGEVPGLIVATAILGLATMEFYSAMRKVGYNPASLLGLILTVGLTVGAYWKNVAAYPVVLFLVVVFALLWYLVPVGAGRPVPNLGITMLGVGYVGILGSFAGLLLSSDSIAFNDAGEVGFQSSGTGLMFAAILATVAYDIGAYAIGRAMGRTPLSTHSPNKTLEGLVGGAVVCLVVTAAVIGGFSVAPWGDAPGGFADTLILGIVAAVAATLGDLCESMIKRDLGVKDMGTMLPGHGGILDRFDGLLFVMPATWCAALALGIVEATSVVSG